MITATEYYLAKALKERLENLKKYIHKNNVSAADEQQRIRMSLENQDILDGYVARINAILSLFKVSILKKENFLNLLEFKKDVALLSANKDYDSESSIKKLSVLEKHIDNVGEELNSIIYNSTINKESSSYVTFICPEDKINQNVIIEGRTKFLVLGDKEIRIRNEANTENCKIYSIDKKEFVEMFEVSDQQLINNSLIKGLRENYQEKYGMLFAPTKLGLTPIFEHDVLNVDKDAWNGYLVTSVLVDKTYRLKYFDVLELMKNNFIPNNIVLKQVQAGKSGIVYKNGWHNSSLVNKKILGKLIEEDLEWNNPQKVAEFNAKWDYVYKNKLKNKGKDKSR